MIQLNPKKHSRVMFWTLLSILLGLCIVRYALQVSFPRVILLGMVILIAALGDRDEIVAVCICCIPLHTSLHYAYAVLISVVIYIVKFSENMKMNSLVMVFAAMLVWELMHCFGQPFSIPAFISDCVPLLLLLALLLCCNADQFDYAFIVRALVVSVAAMCTLLLCKVVYLAKFDLVAAFANLQRLGLDSEETKENLAVLGGDMNPNTLGIMCVLAMTGLLQLRQAGQKKMADLVMVIVLLIFGVLTSSRTYLVCLALMGVLLLFSQTGSISRKLKFVGAVVLVILLALGLLYLLFPALLEYYLGRFQVQDLTTGRMDLLAAYHEFIVSDPKVMFFGIGLQNFYTKVLDIYRVAAVVPHNAIQELIIAWGIPGLIMFLVLWLGMILCSRRCNKNQRLINYIPFLVILLKAQAGQMLDSPYTMLAFSYAYLSMCANLKVPEQQTEQK